MTSLGTMLMWALLGGVLPTLLWLWFWLKQDGVRPEPRSLLAIAFLSGVLVVPFVILLEKGALALFGDGDTPTGFTILAWSFIEEIMKFFAGLLIVLRSRANDEPIDAIIYMITVALGFAALENTLFLLSPLGSGDLLATFNTGNLRFIGATVLHTLASAIIGGAMALSFYKLRARKIVYLTIGIVLATALHSIFNFAIITSNGEKMLTIFFVVWVGIILLMLLFEKAKILYNRDLLKLK